MSRFRRPPPTSPDDAGIVELIASLGQQLEIPKLDVRGSLEQDSSGEPGCGPHSFRLVFPCPPCHCYACTHDGQADDRRVAASDSLVSSLPEKTAKISGPEVVALHPSSHLLGAGRIDGGRCDSANILDLADYSIDGVSRNHCRESSLWALPKEGETRC